MKIGKRIREGVVLTSFFDDLSRQIDINVPENNYIIFSGDLVAAGANKKQYDNFQLYFNNQLNKLRINKEQRICVPGNHDTSDKFIEERYVDHEGVVCQNLKEKNFNDYIQTAPNIFSEKFSNYKNFENEFAKYTTIKTSLSGTGWNLNDDIAVYQLNTAICTSCGYENTNDRERLAIDTRSINKWVSECGAKNKILIMHHPISWLTSWAQTELMQLLQKSFSLCLTGHSHNQTVFHSINEGSSLVECSAPPLFTNKHDDLGYSLISISNDGVLDIRYRQWTKNKNFVTGVSFSNTDNGTIVITKSTNNYDHAYQAIVSNLLTERFNNSLRSYSSQPIIWVEPILGKNSGLSGLENKSKDNDVDLDHFISTPKSAIIKAPPQFGLTCLAYYIAKEAWVKKSFFWLYIDFKAVKSINKLTRIIDEELDRIGNKNQQIHGVILDSWMRGERDSAKILQTLEVLYPDIPILVMQTVEDSTFNIEVNAELLNSDFDIFYLLSLSRGHIRKVVSAYNNERQIGDEDIIVEKVTSDLDVLNIHRTPLNCITLLKVSETYFDESPVNRTKMLEMVLFLLFNVEEIPTYKTKPDLKDCEFVLGCFCEKIIRGCKNSFTRDEFIGELESFCQERLIDLEISVVFDVMLSNQIIIKRENQYSFRFTYWIFYFAAQRMHHDQVFADYILQDQRYVSYPEIIEFYTGIDRRREDALRILNKDLHDICAKVNEKVGLPDGMNPFRFLKWIPTADSIEKMKEDITENVLNSNLPKTVKDQHADRNFDQSKPYKQDLDKILDEYSLILLMRCTIACSRALRNCDYVDPKVKQEMLKGILNSWEQLSKVFFAITPLLAVKGSAQFLGAMITLCGDFGSSIEDRITGILQQIPYNVVNMYHSDIYSSKMGPLIFAQIDEVSNQLIKYELIMLLIYKRPRKWRKIVEQYIISLPIDSFFLCDIIDKLTAEYKYSFSTMDDMRDMIFLIKTGFAKHKFKVKKPTLDKVKKLKFNLSKDGDNEI